MRTHFRPRPLPEQVLVVTGASSGMGLATAQLAASRGARVMLSSHDAPALREAERQLRLEGCDVAAEAADVTDLAALERLARATVARWGRIDTWFNNAGTHVFGETMDVPLEDMRRIFEVNYWGMVMGARVAVPYLSRQGGMLLNMSSVLAARAVPLQGIYAASKHAIDAWTDALRMELERKRVPIVVTNIKPAAIHTPIVRHSLNLTGHRAQLPAPMYDTRVAARAIVAAMETVRRDLIIGGVGKLAQLSEKLAPALTDEVMVRLFY
ncbi:MAG: SDR family oxidoreductase, partial [Myxococcales bacterium]